MLKYILATSIAYFLVRIYLKKSSLDAELLMVILVFCPLINIIITIPTFLILIISELFADYEHNDVWNKIFRL